LSGTRVLIDLVGEVGLLLWGTHMVSTGVQRGYGTALRRALERNLDRRWLAFLTGLGVTTLLQSSTATGLMAMSFAAAGVIALQPALAVMLGANVGTAVVAQVLSFNVSVIASPLLLAGVMTFRWSAGSRLKNVGRAAIGLGLMVMALTGMQHTLAPVESTPLLRSILQSLNGEPLLAVLIASLLTWACHSSVAMVLLVASLAGTHLLGAQECLALVLGANLGGAMPALVHASTPVARRLPLGNLLVRFVGVLVLLPLLPQVARLSKYLFASDAREGARLQDILSAVINVEHVSDIVANSLMESAVKQQKRGQSLSADELEAITMMHGELFESLRLAMAIFLRADQADAQRLVLRKARLRELEASTTALCVRRLRDATLANRAVGAEGMPGTPDDSGVLRVVRDLRRIHSHLASFAYPVLNRPQAAMRAERDTR
jgi:Na/Pi-cotransporter